MSNSISAGDIAGSIQLSGYRHIGINKKYYKSSRLAWFYVYGEWPSNYIDHINGDRLDDSINNLRVVTPLMNQQNRKCHRDGVSWGTAFHKKTNTYNARIKHNGRVISLKYYKTREEAHAVSVEYAVKHNIPLLKELENNYGN